MNKNTVANKRLFPEYRGFEFWLTELDPGWGKDADKPNYGYHIKGFVAQMAHCEGGGAYATKHEATKAAFARIETDTHL